MKRILTLLFVLFCSAGIAQEPIFDNFYKQGTDVYWQVINETSLTFDELTNAVKQSGNYTNLDITENQIVCELKPFAPDYKAYGYNSLDAPFFIKNDYSGTVIFELKDNRIRTTIKLINIYQNPVAYKPLEKSILNDSGEVMKAYFELGSSILNNDFTKRTTFHKIDANW